MSTDHDDWFVREILVHEHSLTRMLLRNWPQRDEVHDLRQEIYARVYEAGIHNRPTAPAAFLFATARHLMADRVRRSRVVSIEAVGEFEPSNVYLIDEVSPEQWFGGRQALKRLIEVMNGLPKRCRQVVWLRRVENLSQKDVSTRLGISAKTVEKHLAKGMRLIADHLYGGEPMRRHARRFTRNFGEVEDEAHARQQVD